MYRIEWFKGESEIRPWHSRIVCVQNGQIVWDSQGHTTKRGCLDPVENFAKWSLTHGFHEADIIEIK